MNKIYKKITVILMYNILTSIRCYKISYFYVYAAAGIQLITVENKCNNSSTEWVINGNQICTYNEVVLNLAILTHKNSYLSYLSFYVLE